MRQVQQISAVLAPFTGILLFLGAVAALCVYAYKLAKKINATLVASQHAEHAARGAAEEARATADQSAITNGASAEAVAALHAATIGLETMRDRYDDLMAAYLRQQTVEARVRLIERWAEEQEDQVHKLTRAISTTGAAHADPE